MVATQRLGGWLEQGELAEAIVWTIHTKALLRPSPRA